MKDKKILITPSELMIPDAGTKKNFDTFEEMLKITSELIKEGKLKK